MALIWVNHISISFGRPLLLDGASLQIEAGSASVFWGETVLQIDLMKLLSGNIPPDDGEISRDKNIHVSVMPQEVPDLRGTVYDVVAGGCQEHLDLLPEYHDLTLRLHSGGDQLLKKSNRSAPFGSGSRLSGIIKRWKR